MSPNILSTIFPAVRRLAIVANELQELGTKRGQGEPLERSVNTPLLALRDCPCVNKTSVGE
jgi:hypothetical protein